MIVLIDQSLGSYCDDITSLCRAFEISAQTALSFLNKLDLVTVRVFDERNVSCTMLHWARFSGDLNVLRAELVTSFVNVFSTQSDVTESVTQIIGMAIVIVGELDAWIIFRGAVAQEGESEFSLRVIGLRDQIHTKKLGIKFDGFLEVIYSDHGVQVIHIWSFARKTIVYGHGGCHCDNVNHLVLMGVPRFRRGTRRIECVQWLIDRPLQKSITC